MRSSIFLASVIAVAEAQRCSIRCGNGNRVKIADKNAHFQNCLDNPGQNGCSNKVMASLFCQIRQDIIDGNKDVADDMVLLRRIASPHEHLYLYPYVDKDGKRLGDSVKGDCPDLDKGLFALRSRAVSVLRDPCSVNVVTPE